MPRAFIPLLLAVAWAAACGTSDAPQPAPAKKPAARPATPPDPPRVVYGGRPTDGVPHNAPIRAIELAPDGSAALTRDAIGSVRVWAALDGSVQPQPVPVRGALHMSLARRGDRGLLLALIDPTGELRLLRADPRGRTQLVEAADGGGRPAIGVRVLPGGERAVVLRDDHTLDLVDGTGARLARLTQRGFRPVAIAAAARGRLLAISLRREGTGHLATLHRIDVADRSLTLHPSSIDVSGPAGVSPAMWSVSPSGRRVAMLLSRPGAAWHLAAADLEDGGVEELELPLARGEEVSIGFVDERNVVLSGRPHVGSWRIDVADKLADKGAVYPAFTPDDRDAELVYASAPGTRAAAVGAWLWVEAAGRDRVYLGYRPFVAEDAAISPDNRWVAWVSAGEVHMQPLRGQATARPRLPVPDEMIQYRRVFFLDERHLLLVDTTGKVELVDWSTGAELHSVDAGGVAADVQMDGRRGLMAALRPGGQVWIYRVSAASGLRGPLLVGDGASRAGFLDHGNLVLWTVDQSNRLRTYSMADLERGMSRSEASGRGVSLPGMPKDIDRQGRLLLEHPSMRRMKGAQYDVVDRSFTLPPGATARVLPSPDGSRIAFARADGLVTVFEGTREQASWSRAFVDIAQAMSWSRDGSLLAVASHNGSAVVDAATGKFVELTCGPQFEVRRTPPLTLVASAPRLSLCEAALEQAGPSAPTAAAAPPAALTAPR